MPRKVSGSSKSAAAASAEVMPGTISKETPASLRSGHFLAGAAEDQRIAGFEPDHALASRPSLTSRSLISFWLLE
jgi:hypothetical protein